MATKPPPPPDTDGLDSLREPFDDDQIQQVKGYSNVAPHHYTQKLVDSGLPYGTTASFKGVILDADRTPLAIVAEKSVSLGDGRQVGGIGSHPFPVRFKNQSEEEYREQVAYAVKSAHSDALKIALKDAGVGLDLYKNDHGAEVEEEETPAPRAARSTKPAVQEDEEEEQPRPRTTERRPAAASPKPARSNGYAWDGKKPFKFGKKHEGKVWSEIPDGYLNWMSENVSDDTDYNKTILGYLDQELKRREETGESVADEPRAGGARKSPRRSGGRQAVDQF